MRKTFFLLLLFTKISIRAQNDTSGFKGQWDLLFQNFKDHPAVSTGVLWDKAITDSSEWFFTGKETDPAADFKHWSDIYQSWEEASNSKKIYIRPYDSVVRRLHRYFEKDVSVVPLLYIHVNTIKTKAIEGGLMALDTLSGTFRSPDPSVLFDKRTIVAAAPFVQTVFRPSIKLFFDNEFCFTNTGAKIKSIRIRINNDQFANVPLGEIITIDLNQAENIMTIEYRFDNDDMYFAGSRVIYEALEGQDPNTDKAFNTGDEQWNIYASPLRATETGEPLGAFVPCMPGHSDGKTHTCITSPVIFVEGIDFGWKDHPTGCYGGKCGSLGLRDLKNGNIYNPFETKIKDRYEDWDAIKKAPFLLEELNKRGYDLFYLDFHNGADYMENNAMLLVELIKRINSRKCGSEEIVVIGASMGGQVARYAMSYMEKHGIPHCVRTYLSFDSPHKGANIPLGLQRQLEYYKGKLPLVKDKYKRKIDRAATKQLLLYHCMAGTQASTHILRTEFVNSLAKLGNYPSFSRNIGLINGSLTAGDQGYKAGDKLLSINPYAGRVIFDFVRLSSTVFATYASVEGKRIVMEARFPFRPKGLSEVQESTMQYDHIPGAKRFDLKESRAIYGLFNVVNHKDATCFIPSISALDIHTEDPYYDIIKNIPERRQKPGEYPFHAYYGPQTENEEHVMLTDGNISWILEEIEKNRIELPEELSATYNYGQYERFLFRGTRIVNGGKLQFNGNCLTGFGSGPYDILPEPGSYFEAFTTDCGPVTLIETGGEMVVGDQQGNKATVHFRAGSRLYIHPGGILKIHNASKLVVEEGAIIIYHPGARIILEGEEAVLQIDGSLQLESDATLSVEKNTAPLSGFIKFRNAGTGNGIARIIVAGHNAKVDLKGAGRYNKILEIEGELTMPVSFRIADGTVCYGPGSRILAQKDVSADNTVFKGPVSVNSDAVHIHSGALAKFTNCLFSQFDRGMWLKETGVSFPSMTMEACQLRECHVGVQVIKGACDIKNSVFARCLNSAIAIEQPSADIRISDAVFSGNGIGIDIKGMSDRLPNLFLAKNSFTDNDLGLQTYQCRTVLSCNRFLSNHIAVSDADGEINVSRTKRNTGSLYSSTGGDNTLAYNTHGFKLSRTLFFLNEGFNNFIQSPGIPSMNFVSGDVLYNMLTHELQPPFSQMANDNYWDPAPAGSLMNGIYTHYCVRVLNGGKYLNPGYLNGIMANAMSMTCLRNPCNPCDKVVPENEALFTSTENVYSTSGNILVPVNDELIIPLTHTHYTGNMKVRVYDLQGKVLAEEEFIESLIKLDTYDYAEGIYLLELSGSHGKEVKMLRVTR